MASYTWRGLSGLFNDSGNWDQGSVPSSGDTAQFAANGGTIYGTGTVSAVSFSAFAWTVGGSITADNAAASSGTLAIAASGQLVVNGPFSDYATPLTIAGLLQVAGGGATSWSQANVALSTGGRAVLSGALTLGNVGATVSNALLSVGGLVQIGTSSGGAGSLAVQQGGLAVFSAPVDFYNVYLQIGAAAGSNVAVTVTDANSQLVVSNTSTVGSAGTGSLNVVAGGAARFTSSYNAASSAQRSSVGGSTGTVALTIGQFASGVGTVAVSGSASTLAANGSLLVGGSGRGTLSIAGGATANSSAVTAAQAALAVGAAGGSSGTVSVDGAGSMLTANGVAILGGDNRGAGLAGGGTGAIGVTNGGALQTGSMTILAGSSLSVDGASSAAISGDLLENGTLSSAGTLSVGGTAYGAGTIRIGGGLASFGALSSASLALASPSLLVRIAALAGTSAVSGMQSGDVIDLVGMSASLSGNTVSAGGGALALGAAPTGLQYQLDSDGAGGTFVSLGVDTIGVYRFFDSNYGTHFFSSSSTEKNAIVSGRPDLVYEGVGLQAIDPASPDPNAASVYRFFDSKYGTHFFTASAAERDQVIAARPDLVYEGVGFVEHTAQQAGDVPVFRFFDTRFGTHFYTADGNERASIAASRPDLVYEGVGFYAPG